MSFIIRKKGKEGNGMVAYFGALSLSLGYLNLEQLAHAVGVQNREGKRRPLGAICKELGYLTDEQIQTILEHQRRGARDRKSLRPRAKGTAFASR